MFRFARKINPIAPIRRNLFNQTHVYPIVKGEHQFQIKSKDAEFEVQSTLTNNKMDIVMKEKDFKIQTKLLDQPFDLTIYSKNSISLSHYQSGGLIFINIKGKTPLMKRITKISLFSGAGSLLGIGLIGAGIFIGFSAGIIGAGLYFLLNVLHTMGWF